MANEHIQRFDKDSEEYRKLNLAAAMLNFLDLGREYKVEDIFFDVDQDWMWTTVCVTSKRVGGESYFFDWAQAFTPKMQKDILDAENIAGIENIVKIYLNDLIAKEKGCF